MLQFTSRTDEQVGAVAVWVSASASAAVGEHQQLCGVQSVTSVICCHGHSTIGDEECAGLQSSSVSGL